MEISYALTRSHGNLIIISAARKKHFRLSIYDTNANIGLCVFIIEVTFQCFLYLDFKYTFEENQIKI